MTPFQQYIQELRQLNLDYKTHSKLLELGENLANEVRTETRNWVLEIVKKY